MVNRSSLRCLVAWTQSAGSAPATPWPPHSPGQWPKAPPSRTPCVGEWPPVPLQRSCRVSASLPCRRPSRCTSWWKCGPREKPRGAGKSACRRLSGGFFGLGTKAPAESRRQPGLAAPRLMQPSANSSPARQENVVRSAGVVSAAVLLSRLTGLVREIAMARLFGAGVANDAFVIGFRIPNLTRDLFAEGALSSAFVPTFTSYLQTKGKAQAAHLSNLVATALILIVSLVCAAGMIWTPQLVTLLAGKFAQVPGKFELAVTLTRTMFPFLLLVALAAQAMGVLNASNRFGMPALASSFFNVGSLVFGLAAGFWAGPRRVIPPVQGMAYGVIFGGAVQLLCQLPGLARCGFAFRPAVDWSHPGLRHIFALMGPAILVHAAVQVNGFVNTSFASGILHPAGHVMTA